MFTMSLSRCNCGIGSGMGMEGGAGGGGVQPGVGVSVMSASVIGGVVSAVEVEDAEAASVGRNGSVHVRTGVRAGGVGEGGNELHAEARTATTNISSGARFMSAYCSPF